MGSSWVGLGRKIPEDKQTLLVGDTYGFWADDAALYVWLHALGGVIDEAADVPAWLEALRKAWVDIPAGGGCVFTSLEDFLTDDDRSQILLRYVSTALERLLDAKGDAYDAFASVRQISNPAIVRDSSVGARAGMIELAANFIWLLQGRLKTGECLLPARGYLYLEA